MTTNQQILSYTGISYEDVIGQINTKILADPRFQNYNDSQISALLNQILASSVDFLTFLMDSCFAENFFQTAKLKSSVINLSRNLGYSVQRPISSTAKMQVKLFGQFNNMNVGDTIQIPYHSQFSFGDSNFILKDSLYIPITAQMQSDMGSLRANYSSVISVDYKGGDITLIEGTIKENIIIGNNNPQVANIFQLYKITDKTFSNHYGDSDFSPNEVTQVYCGVNKNRKYLIDKRSVINWENFVYDSSTPAKGICVVRTGSDEGIEILFGDGIFADIGAKSTAESVWISYLSTKGSKGNQTGLIGEKLTYSGKVYSSTNQDLTNNIEFQFKTNPTGGSDMESLDSIKMNAPSIYYSLDRLVTQKDYINYLKSLTSPITVKNALAWGEQGEITKHVPLQTSDIKMFNVVLFTVLGSLYNVDVSPYSPRETNSNLNLAVLDSNYNEDEVPIRGYFNIYMRQDQVDQLLEYTTSASYWNTQGIVTSATSILADTQALASYGTASLSASYSSKNTETTLIGTSALLIDVSDMVYQTSVSAAMNTIASRITTQLITIKDERGLIATNTSKGQDAFDSIKCYYNPNTYTLATSASSNDPCYLYTFTGDFANAIGLSGISASQNLQTATDYIAENIVAVRDLIQERAQITTKSVYLSPIIHTFNLSGSVYVSPLYDLETTKTQVEDLLYSFFNLNADFNVPIHISEVVDIVKNNLGVKYCDIGFQSTYPSRSDGQTYVYTELMKSIYSSYWDGIYPSVIFGLPLSQALYVFSTTVIIPSALSFNERTLLNQLKSIYDVGVVSAKRFAVSNDFLNFCTAVRKDNVRYIRDHLINPHGNIGEGLLQTDNSTLYDFSVGSEIVKIRCSLNYVYKG
jgi:hypothetical protein